MGRLDDYDDIDDMLIVGGKTFVYKGTDTAKMIEEAYNKGKSDAEKEHLETCDSCIHKVSAEDIEQIRADAIEEFVKAIEKHQTRQDSYLDPPYVEMGLDMTDVLVVAEQLKEQNDGK